MARKPGLSSAKKTPKSKSKKTRQNTPLPGAFDLFKPSVNAFVLNIGVFLALIFFPMLLVLFGGLTAGILALFALSARSTEIVWMGAGLFSVIFFAAIVLGLVMAAAMPYLQLQSVRNQKVALSEALRAGMHYFWRFLGLCISIGFLVIVGLLLFVVPGIIFIRRYFLSVFFLVDQDGTVFESMRRSAEVTKNNSGAVWGVIGVNLLIGLSGIFPYVGGIVSFILQLCYYCAPAMRYEQLKDQKPLA